MLDSSTLQFGLLFAAGLIAGVINVLAGGGSALTVPALMIFGLPGDVANATNRVAVFTQSVTGSASFQKAGKFRNTQIVPITILTIIGATGGAVAATYLPNEVFEPLILVCMLGVAVLVAKQPKFGVLEDAEVPLQQSMPAVLTLLASGFYGGFLQAGVGYMLLAALCGQLHYDLARANAIKVFVVVIYTIPALIIFAIGDLIDWQIAIPLVIGTSSGAWIGVRYATSVPSETLRKALLVCVVAMCAVLVVRMV